jgi:hypothetical protein
MRWLIKADEIVFADALQDQKHRRGVAGVGDEMWRPDARLSQYCCEKNRARDRFDHPT